MFFTKFSDLFSFASLLDWKNKENNLERLIQLPNISYLYIKNVTEMSGVFEGCSSLKLLPDLSIWNIKKVINMKKFLNGCSSLKYLPDISNWDTINITDISGMFEGCSSLITLPDISKWNTINTININSMFKECSSLKSLPDISSWNTINITDMSSIFEGCTLLDLSSLKSLPEIKGGNPIKIVLTGDSGVGCNSLAGVANEEEFREDNPPITCWTFRQISFFYLHREFKVNIWNGPGQPRMKHILKMFIGEADIILFVYSITDKYSFEDLASRIEIAKEANGDNFKGIIVANKFDLFMEQVIDDEEGLKFAQKYNFEFYLTSAKEHQKQFRNFLKEFTVKYYSNLVIDSLKKKNNESLYK